MLIPPSALQTLADAGIGVVAAAADAGVEVVLTVPDRAARLAVDVRSSGRPVGPSAIARLTGRGGTRVLLVVPTASAATRAAAREHGVSLIALNDGRPDGHLVIDGATVPLGAAPAPAAVPRQRSGPRSWGTFTVARVLLLTAARTQHDVARLAGVSQPRVSQVLRLLADDGLAEARPHSGERAPRWHAPDRDALLAWWLDRYPGPGGVTTHWLGLDRPADQAAEVVAVLTRGARPPGASTAATGTAVATDARVVRAATVPAVVTAPAAPTAVVSGDVAADVLAPWARPRTAIVYARRGADLTDLGLTPCPPADATLSLVVPEDRGVWALAGAVGPGAATEAPFPLADPLQVLWDVRRSWNVDADQSADQLAAWLCDHLGGDHLGGDPRGPGRGTPR